ncbi:MAG TPA: SRPBCC domain-containing protein [Trebonia sp.]|jgi:uncharacterized protein YndB with AHSA1/START domain|nr:SRPBCC domain-containing protein [Trebonia sp.]
MTDTDRPDGIRLVRLIPAPPAEVSRAFLDPGVLARWFGPAEFTVLEQIPEHKLVLAWSRPPEDTTLTVLLRPVPGGATELTLRHERLGDAPYEDPAGIRDRWAEAIGKLADLHYRAATARSGEDGALRLRRVFPAAPDRLFAAWTVPAVMSRWLFVGPSSRIISATVDLRVGGGFSIRERPDGFGDVDHVGEYLDVRAPGRLAFSLEVPAHFPGRSEIRLEISAAGAGSELAFTQHGVEPGTVRSSWEMMFDGLARACASPVTGPWAAASGRRRPPG